MELLSIAVRLVVGLIGLPILAILLIWRIVYMIQIYLKIKKSPIPETTICEFRGARLLVIRLVILFVLLFLYTFWPFIKAVLFL